MRVLAGRAHFSKYEQGVLIVAICLGSRFLADITLDASSTLQNNVLMKREIEIAERTEDDLHLLADTNLSGQSRGFDVISDQNVLTPDVKAEPVGANHACHEAAVMQADSHVESCVLHLRTDCQDDGKHRLRQPHDAVAPNHLVCVHGLRLIHGNVSIADGANLVNPEQLGDVIKLGEEMCHEVDCFSSRVLRTVLSEADDVCKEESHVVVGIGHAQAVSLHLHQHFFGQETVEDLIYHLGFVLDHLKGRMTPQVIGLHSVDKAYLNQVLGEWIQCIRGPIVHGASTKANTNNEHQHRGGHRGSGDSQHAQVKHYGIEEE
mmetsp:Transcript_47699/g.77393  ORF Transcript_47699/g.77393 Transcript_47699/m.77393 type:complete len:320 (-) Transcript_47699:237-1196(-)